MYFATSLFQFAGNVIFLVVQTLPPEIRSIIRPPAPPATTNLMEFGEAIILTLSWGFRGGWIRLGLQGK